MLHVGYGVGCLGKGYVYTVIIINKRVLEDVTLWCQK